MARDLAALSDRVTALENRLSAPSNGQIAEAQSRTPSPSTIAEKGFARDAPASPGKHAKGFFGRLKGLLFGCISHD